MMSEYGDKATLLAGGHSLIPALKLRLNDYGYLIDISKIQDLKNISENGNGITIGAGVSHAAIAQSSLLQSKISFFAEAAELIGDVQVRNMGTIGGSIAHADPAADWPALLLASGASIEIQNNQGKKEVKAEDFFQGLFTTSLEEGDMITAIHLPVVENASSKYMKFMHPASRFALVGCAAQVLTSGGKCEMAHIAYAGVSSKPFRDESVEKALIGNTFNEETISAAAEKAAEGVSIMSDHFATESYRKQMAKVYTKRTLLAMT